FLEAAKTTSVRRALELRQRAGAQLLMGGHIEEGLAVYRVVLEAVGLKLAKGPKSALLSLIKRRLWIRLRGLNFAALTFKVCTCCSPCARARLRAWRGRWLSK